jgi:hypothetical protein
MATRTRNFFDRLGESSVSTAIALVCEGMVAAVAQHVRMRLMPRLATAAVRSSIHAKPGCERQAALNGVSSLSRWRHRRVRSSSDGSGECSASARVQGPRRGSRSDPSASRRVRRRVDRSRIMVASRWPWRLPPAASISLSTSPSVRCSRGGHRHFSIGAA